MAKYIVKGKGYKVKDKDTIESIAKANGITVDELAKFNWGTMDKVEINNMLRDKVGSRQKSADGKEYILSKEDDPGIIYIPQDFPEIKIATNSSYTITIKPITRKPFVTSKCLVTFRPSGGWKGEYGFDWMRIGDRGTEHYKSPLLTGGYNGTDDGMSAADAEDKIKLEYEIMPTEIAGNPDCRVPFLNIFHAGTAGNPNGSAKLKLHIVIENHAADLLRIEVPLDSLGNPCFEVSPSAPLPTGVGTHDVELTFKCIKEVAAQGEIKVIAETKEEDGTYKESLAGRVIVLPNKASDIKSMKFVLVKVITDSTDTGLTSKGDFTGTEKIYLRNALHQALVLGEFEDGPDLDLSSNDDFKTTSTGIEGVYYTSANPAKTGLWEDHPDFFTKVRQLFLDIPGNNKYSTYFTVFAFGERPYDRALGQVQKIGIHNLIIFPARDNCTTNHEVLHGLGLMHSFKSAPVKQAAKFTFQKGKTDNIMDYTYDSSALITWRWQWKIIH